MSNGSMELIYPSLFLFYSIYIPTLTAFFNQFIIILYAFSKKRLSLRLRKDQDETKGEVKKKLRMRRFM